MAARVLYDEKHFPVEAAAVYWHFVDVVWIFFYPALYLIGAIAQITNPVLIRSRLEKQKSGRPMQVAPILGV